MRFSWGVTYESPASAPSLSMSLMLRTTFVCSVCTPVRRPSTRQRGVISHAPFAWAWRTVTRSFSFAWMLLKLASPCDSL